MIDEDDVKQVLYLHYHTSMKLSHIAKHVGIAPTSVTNIIERYEPEPCEHCGQPVKTNDEDK